MASRRDSVYKQLFSHPEIVRDLLVGLLPAEWARALTVDGLERVNASYASDHGKARHADVVWRARIGGEWVYVYILLEFQARPDKWMALRMHVYLGLLYQDLVAQHRLSKHGKLPPVLPIVLYHGRRPWRAATELARLMLVPPIGLERYQANQQYLLIDRHHAGARGDIVSLLFDLLQSRSEVEMRAAIDALTKRVRQPDMAAVRESLMNWLQLTLQDASSDTSMNVEEGFVMEMERKFTFKEMFDPQMFERPRKEGHELGLKEGREEGRQQGLQEGRQEGRREGLQEGLQEGRLAGELLALRGVLRSLLANADLPPEAVAKIGTADSHQLNDWIKALFGGASPRQLFAEG